MSIAVMNRQRAAIFAGAAFAGALLAGQAMAANHPDLTGFWEPESDKSLQHGPKPVFTPEVQAEQDKARANFDRPPADPTKPTPLTFGVGVGSRYCLPLVQPWNLYQSAPIDISSDDRETTMMYEGHSLPWHIYTDGRGHQDPAHVVPQANGDSIGHWDGDKFVVDSVNFTTGMMPFDGVPRSPTSHVTEVFTVDKDGQHLHAQFTVDDPKVLQQPYTWSMTWKRADASLNYAQLWACDPRDSGNSHY